MTTPDHLRFLAPAALAAIPGFTPVVEVTGGKLVVLSGQVALDASGKLVGQGDFRAQAEQVFANIKAGLAAAGADFRHVVKLNIYMVNRADVPALREVRDRYVSVEAPPASTLLVVAGLVREELLLEVEALASVPG